nr:unnamed protein product [Callosobruchus analis]
MFVTKPGDERPYLDVQILGEPLIALADSGSSISILGNLGFALLEKWNVKLSLDYSLQVTTADGVPQASIGNFIVPITLGNMTKDVQIWVIPSINYSLVLGIDFLKTFKIHANFPDNHYQMSVCVVNTICPAENLNPQQKAKLSEVIDLFKSIGPTDRLGRTHLLTHHIDTGQAKPFRQRQYPLSPAMQKHLDKEIDQMLKQGLIRPSHSPYCSPLWLVKKASGEYRICFDGRKLNSITCKDAYPMPLIDSVINKLRDARFLSSIDLKSAFFQIPLDEESRPKTAFAVRGRGLFEFCVMPFGLSCSAQSMCRLMDMVIGPALEPYVFYYLDDIVIATPDFELHLDILRKLFERLKQAGLTVNFEKCEFCRPSLKFLGFVVDEKGLRTDESKVSAIVDYPTPKTTTQVRRLIGLVGYYRRFLKNFASICSPISDLLKGRKKGQNIEWTDEADRAFAQIKQSLTTAPVLASPDFSKPFVLYCDASDTGVGSVLYQETDGIEHPIAYASKTLNKCQRKYTVTEKELYSIIVAIEKFRGYIEGTHFTVITDHASLIWLNKLNNPSGRLARWAVRLSQFDFTIVHRKGSLNVVADALSRSVAVLNLETVKLDGWYIKMVKNVQEKPDDYPSYKVENGILYKHIFSKDPLVSNVTDWKIVVPRAHRKEVVKMYHDSETAAHLGISKTISRVSELYYWPFLHKYVYRYVKNCKTCASCKVSNLPKAGLMGSYKNINFPFQLVSCDLLGPYPRSKSGNQYLLVVIDWFTKFTLVHPLRKATVQHINKFLENNVFLMFGVPQIIVCDNGPQFRSKDFKSLMEEYKVQKYGTMLGTMLKLTILSVRIE